MIDSLLIWGLWPFGIFAVVQMVKYIPAFTKGGKLHGMVPALPMLIGALTGPWGAPWILAGAASEYALPPVVISAFIGAGAGLCSQGVYDLYTRWLRAKTKVIDGTEEVTED